MNTLITKSLLSPSLGKLQIMRAEVKITDGARLNLNRGTYAPNVLVCVELEVRDAQGGAPQTLAFSDQYPRDMWDRLPRDGQRHIVRGLIQRAFEHEIDEWLTFDGERFRDPHDGEKDEAAE